MLRRLYDWVMALSAHPRAAWALAAVAFVESSVFPIPPHAMLVPMVLAERAKAWFYAALTTISSVLGGMLGYAIGYFLFEAAGKPILDFYGKSEAFAQFAERYNEWGAWIVFIAGVTPFPYKVITIASGATQLNFIVFMVASIAARGAVFFRDQRIALLVRPTDPRLHRKAPWPGHYRFLYIAGRRLCRH